MNKANFSYLVCVFVLPFAFNVLGIAVVALPML